LRARITGLRPEDTTSCRHIPVLFFDDDGIFFTDGSFTGSKSLPADRQAEHAKATEGVASRRFGR
jgi:hypothetical protein